MNTLEKEFAPFQEALELKELGFDEPCFGWFTDRHLRIGAIIEHKHVQGENELLAPTFSQCFRWFREKYGCNGVIEGSKRNGFEWCIYREEYEYVKPPNNTTTYEEAELACLRNLIEIAKTK